MEPESEARPERARFLPAQAGWDPSQLQMTPADDVFEGHALGDLGLSVRVSGRERFPPTHLVLPVAARHLVGLDPATIRVVRVDDATRGTEPIWTSGLNATYGFVWAEIRQPGVYAALGLPRDRVVQSLLRKLAQERRLQDATTVDEGSRLAGQILSPLVEAPAESIEQLRQFVSKLEVETGPPEVTLEVRFGDNAEIAPFPLPGDVTFEEFRGRLEKAIGVGRKLPEEDLFFPPDPQEGAVPWPVKAGRAAGGLGVSRTDLARLQLPADLVERLHLGWLFDRDWWMYHHDEGHGGQASGFSAIHRGSMHRMRLLHEVQVDGPIVSVPAVVDGHVYVGTGNNGSGGSLYRVNLYTAAKTSYTVVTPPGRGSRQGYPGIACTPAVTDDRVYFSALNGKVYCLDAATLGQIWVTNLRNPDPAHNQPLQHIYDANGWSSPLVVNGRLYVGFGEGETNAFGFVYCLDAGTGRITWIYCTNKFSPGAGPSHNQPNVVPVSMVPGGVLPGWASGFSTHPDPDARGAAPWSSAAYSWAHDRIYIGTGNPIPDSALPSRPYSAGVLSLDARTGAFGGFFQPTAHDSYRDADSDIDVPSGPTVYWDGHREVVAFGSKNGSFFLLRSDTLGALHRRQLLPYRDNDRNQPLPTIGPLTGGENHFGVFGSAAVDWWGGRLFVGLGGYSASIDNNSTPFIRALSWTDLSDAWPTFVDANGITKYSNATPPLYTTPLESGLSSPAVVNDVVFVSTKKPGLYALRASDGLCLWAAGDLGPGPYVMGPAVYGNYVVVGCGDRLRIYWLPEGIITWPRPWWLEAVLPPYVAGTGPPWPWPPPPPPPWGDRGPAAGA